MPATFNQLVVWTALPDGTLPGNPDVLQISVAVSPRLASTGAAPQMLGSWPDWLDWPAHSLSFSVHIGSRPSHRDRSPSSPRPFRSRPE